VPSEVPVVSSVVAPLSFPPQASTSEDVIAKLPNASPNAIAKVSINLFMINASCFAYIQSVAHYRGIYQYFVLA
jgi:hypothetical protein